MKNEEKNLQSKEKNYEGFYKAMLCIFKQKVKLQMNKIEKKNTNNFYTQKY